MIRVLNREELQTSLLSSLLTPLQAGPAQLPADPDPPVEADAANNFEMLTADAYKKIDKDSELCQCPLLGSMNLQCSFCLALY